MSAPVSTPKKPLIDLQDALLLLGIASIVTGVALWSVPAALITFGFVCLVLVVMIQRTRDSKEGGKTDGSALQ